MNRGRGRGRERNGKRKREGKGDPVGIHRYLVCSSFIIYAGPTINAINNVSACSVLFLSTTGLFQHAEKMLEHETKSSALTFF